MPISIMTSQTTPYREIRASYTPTTITVYQAYNTAIATAAVSAQKLNASPKFSTSRMTWIKPSWAWMLYRSGYSYKDAGQAHILALHMTHEAFTNLLRKAVLSHGHDGEDVDSGRKARREKRGKPASVRVQWDPERTIRLGKLEWRSIQIGVPGACADEFVNGIVKIEDVTERARELKRVLDEEPGVSVDALIERNLVPEEGVFEVDEELRKILFMDKPGEDELKEDFLEDRGER